MSLRSLLKQSPRFDAPALPGLNSLRGAASRILARWPDVVAEPPENDRDRLVGEMRRRLEADDWGNLPISYVTAAARALFDSVRRSRPDLEGVRNFYFEELRVSTRRSFLNAMASIYVGSYVPDALHTRALAEALRFSRSRLGPRWAKLEDAVPEWLDPVDAPGAIAACMVGVDDAWSELKTIGFSSPHAPGLMDHAHLSYVTRLGPKLRQRSELERLFGWLRPERQAARMSGAAEAISAVLDHWRDGDPEDEDQRYITETLVGCYGDPRVSGGGAWAGVAAPYQAVILRWLTKENILFFLDVVSEVETSHMWEPRREFWLSLYDQGRIKNAWVAFSSEAARHARRRAAARSGQNTLSFGLQTAGGSRVNTSLLILEIGNKILVEGSHSYKIHLFRAGVPKTPPLYLPRYDCEVIRLTAGAEAKSHNGNWQGWVLERI